MHSKTIWFAGVAVAISAVAAAGGCSSGSGGAGGTGGTSASTTTSTTSTTSTGMGGTGGSTTSTTSGTGGMPPVAADTCAMAKPVTLKPGDTLMVSGTTDGAADDYDSMCSDTVTQNAPDVVYEIVLPQEVTFSAKVVASAGSSLQPAIDIRIDCSTMDICSDYGTTSENFLQDLPAGTYYFIVDGKNATKGAFDLTIQVTAPKCGDGVQNPGEDCDPGAAVANDGCGDPGAADACKYQAVTAAKDKCPGEAIAVPGGKMVLTAAQGYSTFGFTDDYAGSCSGATGGRDRVFQLTPSKTGMMTVSVGYQSDGVTPACQDPYDPACWDWVLYARTTCAAATPELGCSDSAKWFSPETLTFPVVMGVPVFVFVDGYNDDKIFSTGPFNLAIDLQ